MIITRGYVGTAHGQVHYRRHGAEGPWLFLFHTSPLSGAEYEGVFHDLGTGIRAVAFDNPGYGMIDPPIALDRRAVPLVRQARLVEIAAPPGISAPHAAPALYARALRYFLGV